MNKTITISGKCSDMFGATLYDENDDCIGQYDGYVPDIFGGGDYIELEIDIETGKIVGWENIDKNKIDKIFHKESEEE
jgi:hypothetical protein